MVSRWWDGVGRVRGVVGGGSRVGVGVGGRNASMVLLVVGLSRVKVPQRLAGVICRFVGLVTLSSPRRRLGIICLGVRKWTIGTVAASLKPSCATGAVILCTSAVVRLLVLVLWTLFCMLLRTPLIVRLFVTVLAAVIRFSMFPESRLL